MVNEQKAAGLWASNNANGYGTAGKNLDSKLVLSEGILLPFGLVWALVIANCDESPLRWQVMELLDQVHGLIVSTVKPSICSSAWR